MIRSLNVRFRALTSQAREESVALRIVISNDALTGYSDVTIARLVVGCAVHLGRVAVAYDLPGPTVELIPHGHVPPRGGADAIVAWLHIVPKIPGDPSDQGWHSLDSAGKPDGFVSVAGLDLDGLSEVLSHELAETLVDPDVNWTVRAANGDTWPIEVCDAVQAANNAGRIAIELGDGQAPVMCANYVLPAYWSPTLPGPFDALGALADRLPALAPDGYSAVRKADGNTVDIYGHALPEEKLDPRSRVQLRAACLRQRTAP